VVDTTVRAVPESSAASPSRRKEVESSSFDDGTDAYVNPPLPGESRQQRSTAPGGQATGTQTNANTRAADSPPIAPSATADDAATKAATKGQGGAAPVQKNDPAKNAGGAPAAKKAAAPVAPEDNIGPELQSAPPGDDAVLRRESMRPTYSRVRAAARRNVLFGTVETDDGVPRSEVPVTVVNRSNSFLRHSGASDAFGTFAIKVPDGQWIVRVTMPSGSQQSVRSITVRDGKVLDNQEGREVQNLIISF
jgi:hypothetical protein